MVEPASVISALPELFDVVLSTLISKGRLCTEQIGRTVCPLCYLMGPRCSLWAAHWETMP